MRKTNPDTRRFAIVHLSPLDSAEGKAAPATCQAPGSAADDAGVLIAAAGDDSVAYTAFQGPHLAGFAAEMLDFFGGDFAALGLGEAGAVIAPSLLFEELDLRGSEEEPEKEPIVPRPAVGIP